MNVYLAFDPGGTTGFAVFHEDGSIMDWGQLTGIDKVVDFLQDAARHNILLIIVEDYRVRGDRQGLKANVGSQLETVQIIGALKMFARQNRIQVVLQPPNIKAIASKWSGVEPKGAHKNSHKVDAYNHGVYWLVKAGVRKINGLEDKEYVDGKN